MIFNIPCHTRPIKTLARPEKTTINSDPISNGHFVSHVEIRRDNRWQGTLDFRPALLNLEGTRPSLSHSGSAEASLQILVDSSSC